MVSCTLVANMWRTWALTFILLALSRTVSSQATCNAHGFQCVTDKIFQTCVDNDPPSNPQTCKSGNCYNDCPVECSTSPCSTSTTKCTTSGYHCDSDTSFKMCLVGSDSPTADTYPCPSNTVCSDNCNSGNPCTPQACPVTCTKSTLIAIPSNNTHFYLCSVNKFGEVTVTTERCADGTIFNPATLQCVQSTTLPTTPPTTLPTTQPTTLPTTQPTTLPTTQPTTLPTTQPTTLPTTQPTTLPTTPPTTLPTTPPTTLPTSQPTTLPTTTAMTTAKPLTCTASGRFPHPTNCSKYYLCSANWNGGFTRYEYNCPNLSYFNIYLRYCCFDARYCVTGGRTRSRSVIRGGANRCEADDVRYADPTSCRHYLLCSFEEGVEEGVMTPRRYACPEGSVFSPVVGKCTSEDNYNCSTD